MVFNKTNFRWNFTKNHQQETFQQKASECSLGQWEIQTFADGSGAATSSVKVRKPLKLVIPVL